MLMFVMAISRMYMHQVPEFLPNAIPSTSTTLRLVVGLLLSYHVTISYILNNQPLSNALHAMISPETLLDYDTYKGRFIWMCITSTLLVFSIGVANSIPFFSTFQSLVGSLMGAPLMFGWPAYFYWKASWRQDGAMKRLDVGLCLIFLFVFLPMCTICGTVSAVQQLLDDWSTSGIPFQCHTTNWNGGGAGSGVEGGEGCSRCVVWAFEHFTCTLTVRCSIVDVYTYMKSHVHILVHDNDMMTCVHTLLKMFFFWLNIEYEKLYIITRVGEIDLYSTCNLYLYFFETCVPVPGITVFGGENFLNEGRGRGVQTRTCI